MSKGVVMEVQKHSVVLLTPDGQFVTCKKLNRTYELGNEIQYTRQEVAIRPAISHYVKPIMMIATCLLLFFLFYKPDSPVMAYVSIDINPSIEASVTSDLHVKDLTAYNQDGKRIVKELKNWKGKSLQDVLQEILVQSEKDGYLLAGKQVFLTSVLKNKNDLSIDQQLEKLSKLFQDKYKKENITVVLQTASLENREEAEKEGISVGTYLKNKENQKQGSQSEPSQSEPSQSIVAPQENSDKSKSASNFVPGEFNTPNQSNSMAPYSSNSSSNGHESSYGGMNKEDQSVESDKRQSSGNKNNFKQNDENKNEQSDNSEKQTEEQKKDNESNKNKNNDKNKSDNHDFHPNGKDKKEHE